MGIDISQFGTALRAAIPVQLLPHIEIISASNGVLIKIEGAGRFISIWPNGECDVDDQDPVGKSVEFHHYQFVDVAGAVKVVLREVMLVLKSHA